MLDAIWNAFPTGLLGAADPWPLKWINVSSASREAKWILSFKLFIKFTLKSLLKVFILGDIYWIIYPNIIFGFFRIWSSDLRKIEHFSKFFLIDLQIHALHNFRFKAWTSWPELFGTRQFSKCDHRKFRAPSVTEAQLDIYRFPNKYVNLRFRRSFMTEFWGKCGKPLKLLLGKFFEVSQVTWIKCEQHLGQRD